MQALPSPECSLLCFHFIGQQACHQSHHLWMLFFTLHEWRCFMLHRCFVDASCCVLGHIGAVSPSLPGMPLLSYSSSRQKLASLSFPTCSHGTYYQYMVSCLQVQIKSKCWFFSPAFQFDQMQQMWVHPFSIQVAFLPVTLKSWLDTLQPKTSPMHDCNTNLSWLNWNWLHRPILIELVQLKSFGAASWIRQPAQTIKHDPK